MFRVKNAAVQKFTTRSTKSDIKGKNVADILDMPISQARDFFEHIPQL